MFIFTTLNNITEHLHLMLLLGTEFRFERDFDDTS